MKEIMFGKRLKELRLEKGLTQKQLALDLNYAAYNISDWEIGRVQPDFLVLAKIALYFGVTTDYLLGLVDY